MQIVLNTLNEREIPFQVVEHEAVYTMEDMERLGLCAHGMVCKNLFLRDAKGTSHFLVLTTKDKQVQLASLQNVIGSTKLSFGSEDRLERFLKLKKGAVTPFGILNDAGKSVEVIVDEELQQHGNLGFHPNVNTATVWIGFDDLIAFIKQQGNPYRVVRL